MVAMWELPLSGDFDVSISAISVDKKFFLQGLADEGAVEVYALKSTPPRWRRLARQSLKSNRVGPQEWFLTVNYGTAPVGIGENKAPDNSLLGSEWSFDTTGQTIHITQSLATVSKTTEFGTTLGDKANAFTLDNKRAIGLSQDRVEGCEKVAPQFQWGVEHTFIQVTGAYLVTLTELTGTTNLKGFFGFPPGSTLFLGASGRFTADSRWRVSFKFASLPNLRNVRISDEITIPEKKGWEHVWVGYLPKQIGNRVFQVPDAAYVEKVYAEADFSFLGIGGFTVDGAAGRKRKGKGDNGAKDKRDNQAVLGAFGKGSIIIRPDGSAVIDGKELQPGESP